MNCELIQDLDALTALEPAWRALYERAPEASPFQHPAWLLPWWNVFGSGQLLCFALWEEGCLVGLVPAFLHPWNGKRQVTFLGNGVSDRLGFLAEPQHREILISRFFGFLASAKGDWDICNLEGLPSSFQLCASCAPRLRFSLQPQDSFSSLALPRTPDDMVHALPRGLRRNLRRYREKLDSQGRTQLETTHSGESFQAALDALFRLHSMRWRSRHEAGMFDGLLEVFHRSAAIQMWNIGKARCVVLSFEERPIAVLYGFLDKARFWSYQTGFDPSLSRFSPGSLILEQAISEAIRNNAREFDFLRGAEEYKATWGARFQIIQRLLVWPGAAS